MVDGRPVQLLQPRAYDGEILTFAAEDADGGLEVRVALSTWERLQAEAPAWMTGGDDRRDFAMGELEALAAELTPDVDRGTRVISIG